MNRSVFEHADAKEFARTALFSGAAQASPPLELFQGGRGVTTYFPVRVADEPAGLINGVFRLEAMVRDCFVGNTLGQFDVRIHDGDRRIFGAEALGEVQRPTHTAKLSILNRTWALELQPKPHLWADLRSGYLPFLLAGLTSSLLFTILLYLVLTRRAQRKRVAGELRTLELQRHHSQKMEALGRLASGIAHDFNNLMTIVRGHAELASEGGALPPRAERSIQEIEKAALDGAALTNQLLAFGRHQRRLPVSMDVNEQVEEMGNMLERLMRDGVEMTFDLDCDLLPVHADPGQMHQLLINLVVNASDAMPDGGALHVRTRNRPTGPTGAPGPWVLLEVEDEGIGIDADVLRHVFEPFFTTKAVG